MPHISAGWRDEMAGVVYREVRWQAQGVICGADWIEHKKLLFHQSLACDVRHD